MNINLKMAALSVTVSLSFIQFSPMASAESSIPTVGVVQASSSQIVELKPTSYPLNDNLKVEVKNLLNESTADGHRIAVTIRMKSVATKVVSIPDMDLRIRAVDGSEYTLQASVLNAHAIRPQTDEELSYMVVVDRKDPLELKELIWLSVDWYTYPKVETELLTVPITGRSWNGALSTINDPAAKKTWG